MNTVLLQTTYFGPIQWYQKLYRYDHVLIEQYDSYQKQTFRNRCVIATANGLQALTVPVEHPSPLTSNKSPIPLGGAGGGLSYLFFNVTTTISPVMFRRKGIKAPRPTDT